MAGDLYREFQDTAMGRFREHEETRKRVDEFASRHGREVLESVYNASWADLEEMCREKPGFSYVHSNCGIATLSYALGVLSRHVYPVPSGVSAAGRERNVVM